MKGKAAAKDKFGVTSIHDLPPELRGDPEERAKIAARKRVAQARLVVANEETALEARQERLAEAEEELEAAEEALKGLEG